MKNIIFFILLIFTLFACKELCAQNQKGDSIKLVYFKSTTGKKWTKAQLDSFLLTRTHKSYRLVPEVTGVEKTGDTLFYKFSLATDPVLKDINHHILVGQQLPNFHLIDMEGHSISPEDLKGKPVIINLWFTQCVPCIAEIPALNKLQEKYKDSGVVFLAITYDKKNAVQQFLKQHPFTFTIIPNATKFCSNITNLYPITLFVNREGIINAAKHLMPPLYNYEVTGRIDELDPAEFEKEINAIQL